LISPFSMSGGGSTRLRDLVKDTGLDWKIILPQEDRYGGSPQNPHLVYPVKEKSFIKLPYWIVKTLACLFKFKPDVVHALKAHPFTLTPAILYKMFSGCRLVYDCDEWDPYTLRDNDAPAWKIMTSRLFNRLGFFSADAILYANHLLLEEKIPARYNDKCFYVPNGVDLDFFKPRWKEDKPGFVVGYLGVLRKYCHIEPIIDAVDGLKEEVSEVKCMVMGGGEGLDKLKSIVEERDLSRWFEFTGRVEREQIPELLSKTDVLVAPFRDMPGVRYQCNM